MLQCIIQGRGGQGAQMAGEILAHAFFQEGKYVQNYATYGGARRGTPVSSFIRVDDKPIRLRCNIESPDVIMCFDPSLLNDALLQGAGKNTLVIINSTEPAECYENLGDFKIAIVNAIAIAQNNKLGRIVNTTLVGAFAGLIENPAIDALTKVVGEMSPVKVDQNINACIEGYKFVRERGGIHGRE